MYSIASRMVPISFQLTSLKIKNCRLQARLRCLHALSIWPYQSQLSCPSGRCNHCGIVTTSQMNSVSCPKHALSQCHCAS